MPGSLTIDHSSAACEPDAINKEMDMSGRFVPMVDSTHDDDDTNSHMSDIPLQLPESANVSSNITSWERPHAKCSQSQSDTESDWGKSLANTVSCYISSKCTCSSWTSRSCPLGYTTSTRSSERSARNGSTCSAPSTKIISCCHL